MNAKHPLTQFWKRFKKNKGAVMGMGVIGFLLFIAIFAPLLSPFSPSEVFPEDLRLLPFWSNPESSPYFLGTDDVGRDLLSRLLYGARVSMSVGLAVVLFSLTIGTTMGLLAGYFGGLVDRLIMGAVDILMSLPSILLAIVVVAILGPGLNNAVIAVGVIALPGFIRITRAAVLVEKSKEYVLASRSFGATHTRQIFKNILPNCLAPLTIQGTLTFSDGILNVAALGFLGLGAQAPTPEWGTMLSDSRAFIESSPWMVTLPGLCILFAVLGFNLLGDGLRDTLDPKLRR